VLKLLRSRWSCADPAWDKPCKTGGKLCGQALPEAGAEPVGKAVNERRALMWTRRPRQPKKEKTGRGRPILRTPWSANYFNELLTVLKTELKLVPTPLTAAMIAIAIPAAIRAYSMAVAPDSLVKNLDSNAFIGFRLACHTALELICLSTCPGTYGQEPKVV
jgi:hypothetical protein